MIFSNISIQAPVRFFTNRKLSVYFTAILSSIVFSSAMITQDIMAEILRPNLLQVSGNGKVRLQATEANLMLAVVSQGEAAKAVQEKLDRGGDQLLAFLKKEKVRNLKTVSYQIQPLIKYHDGNPQYAGFEGRLVVSGTVPVTQLGSLLDRALNEGATEINHIEFAASEDAMATARNEALKVAAKNAREEAKEVLASLGLKWVAIDHVIVANDDHGPQFKSSVMYAREASAGASPIEAGQITVEARLTLMVRFKE